MIIHFSHCFGGGTEQYINNLIEIYNNKEHNYINFLNNKIYIKVLKNNKIININTENVKLLLKKNKFLISHYPIIKYNKNYLNFYKNNFINYIIIHDYTWLENNYI